MDSDFRLVKDVRTGKWTERHALKRAPVSASDGASLDVSTTAPTTSTSAATVRLPSPRKPSTPRGPTFGTSPQRDRGWAAATVIAPHAYADIGFPVDKYSPRDRSPRDRKINSAVFPPKYSLPRLNQDEIVPMNLDAFESRVELKSDVIPPATASQSARTKLRTGQSQHQVLLASLKLASYAKAGRRNNAAGGPAVPDILPLIGLLAGTKPVEILRRYRRYCEGELSSVSKRVPPTKTSVAENQEEVLELTSSRAQLELYPMTYNGPFVDATLQLTMLNAIGGLAVGEGLSADTAKDIVTATVAYNTTQCVTAFQGTEERAGLRSGGPSYHAGLVSYRFVHFFAAASDQLSNPVALRNFAFLLRCFDPTSCGKVPQHLFLEPSFLYKYVTRHVWDGVKDAWIKLVDVLRVLNARRDAEADALLAYVQKEPLDKELSMFTWAIETFVGSHDWHRDRDHKGKPLSKALFGVPWNEARAVFLGVPELAECLGASDLRYDRQNQGPL